MFSCPRCRAELASDSADCFACGWVFSDSEPAPATPSRDFTLSIGGSESARSDWAADTLAPGLTFHSRFSIFHKERIQQNWVWYRVIDQVDGVERWLLVSHKASVFPLRLTEAAKHVTQHPNLFPVVQAGKEPWPYMVLALVSGKPLSVMLEGLTEKRVFWVLREVMTAMKVIHAAGLANVHLQLDSIWITEDGLCKLQLDSVQSLATPALISQDIFSASKLLFWLLSAGKNYHAHFDLSFLSPRCAWFVRQSMRRAFHAAEEFLQALQSVFTVTAAFPLANQQREQLRLDAYEDCILCGEQELALESVLPLIEQAQVFGSFCLRDGWVLLRADPLSAFVLGVIPATGRAAEQLQRVWMKGEDVVWGDGSCEQLVEDAQVGYLISQEERAKQWLHEAEKLAKTSQDWLTIAFAWFFPFAEAGNYLVALQRAEEAIGSTEDALRVANASYWSGQTTNHNLLAKAEQLVVDLDGCWATVEARVCMGEKLEAIDLQHIRERFNALSCEEQQNVVMKQIPRFGRQSKLFDLLDNTATFSPVDKLKRLRFAEQHQVQLLVEKLEKEWQQVCASITERWLQIGLQPPKLMMEDWPTVHAYISEQENIAADFFRLQEQYRVAGLPAIARSGDYQHAELDGYRQVLQQHLVGRKRQRVMVVVVVLLLAGGLFWCLA